MFKRLPPKRKFSLILALAGLVLLALYTAYLDYTVRTRFEGKRFKLPAKVYARALELYPEERLSPAALQRELGRLRYREVEQAPQEPGTYRADDATLELVARPFVFADGPQAPRRVRIAFRGDRIGKITGEQGDALPLVRLDPPLIGGIYPGNYEDRVLVRLAEVPDAVVNGLIAAEDRRFYSHHGIDPRGIFRALVKTASGDGIQGGSTLTQQLVKNFFLTPKRTLRRKFTEMIMALLLEAHYSKQEILETYINEVYLGQDGNRAIHGFGLAAVFFFGKPLAQLDDAESALLVGMLKGPTYFNPRSHPERALERRNLVLEQMAQEGFLAAAQLRVAVAEPLTVVARPPGSSSPYPAFLNLVYRQLKRDYRDEDLRTEGLRIFTTLDPEVQQAAETALAKGLARLERQRGLAPGTLQGALIATSPENAEVQAVVGGRDPRFEGFNRALDALRPIGSLIKPVVYLTALQQPESYTLTSRLADRPLVLQQPGAADWAPQNYDQQFRGQVSLRAALVHSYNVPTVNLGLALGVPAVMANLQRLGVERELPQFASSLLGANALSPLEVTQVYQTLAGDGFYTPLRAIQAVLTAAGRAAAALPPQRRAGGQAGAALPFDPDPAGRGARGDRGEPQAVSAAGHRGRREDRHHRRFPRQLVRRFHRQSSGRGLGWPRRQRADRFDRRGRGDDDLGADDGRPPAHAAGPDPAGKRRGGLDRSGVGPAQRPRLPRRGGVAVHRRFGADRVRRLRPRLGGEFHQELFPKDFWPMKLRPLLFALFVPLLLAGCTGLLPALAPEPSQNAGVLALLDQARQESAADRLPAAGASLERALRIEPRNPVLWQRLAQVRLAQGEFPQAENLAAKSNALAPEGRRLRAENWRIIGQARQGRGDREGAAAAFGRMDSE